MGYLDVDRPAQSGDERPERQTTRVTGLRLDERLGGRTWRAQVTDGRAVIARWLADEGGGQDELARFAARLGALARQGSSDSGALVPLAGVAWYAGAAWMVEEQVRGVPLRRLLRLVQLTPEQAAFIADEAGSAVGSLHDGGCVHGALDLDSVLVGVDGRVWVSGWAAGELTRAAAAAERDDDSSNSVEAARSDDLAAVEALRSALVRGARGARGARGTPGAEAGPEAERRERIRRELAALVGQIPTPGNKTPGAAPTPRGRSARRRVDSHAGAPMQRGERAERGKWARVWVPFAAVAVLALAVGVELVFLHGALSRDLRQLLRSGGGGSSSSASAQHSPGAGSTKASPTTVPRPLPSAAGVLTGVNSRALHGCTAGEACSIGTLFSLRPHSGPVQLRWSFLVVDACTGARVGRPGGTALLRPGNPVTYQVSSVALPQGHALDVFPMTSLPAQAAGSPVQVPADGGSC